MVGRVFLDPILKDFLSFRPVLIKPEPLEGTIHRTSTGRSQQVCYVYKKKSVTITYLLSKLLVACTHCCKKHDKTPQKTKNKYSSWIRFHKFSSSTCNFRILIFLNLRRILRVFGQQAIPGRTGLSFWSWTWRYSNRGGRAFGRGWYEFQLSTKSGRRQKGTQKKDEDWVVVSNIFYCHTYLEKIPILTNIFQMGWNHQPEEVRHTNHFCKSQPPFLLTLHLTVYLLRDIGWP